MCAFLAEDQTRLTLRNGREWLELIDEVRLSQTRYGRERINVDHEILCPGYDTTLTTTISYA